MATATKPLKKSSNKKNPNALVVLFTYRISIHCKKVDGKNPLFNLDWFALYIRNRKNIEAVALSTDFSKVLLHGFKKVHAFKCI